MKELWEFLIGTPTGSLLSLMAVSALGAIALIWMTA